MKNQPVPVPPQPQTAAPIVPADPVISLQNKMIGAAIGFVRRNPWKAAAMVAAAGLVFALSGGNAKAKA